MLVVGSDTEAEWSKLGNTVDAIPDPMVVRTAELWLNGRSGCRDLSEEMVWDAISRNVGALLTFFDAYLTRDALPLIQYWETFASPAVPMADFFPDFFHLAAVDGAVYAQIKRTMSSGLDRDVLLAIPDGEIENVLGEVTAYDHQWQPHVDIDLPEPRRALARYAVGGLVFGAYAQAIGGDHLVQPKRSRLLIALSAPRPELSRWRFEEEQRLFTDFAKACAASPGVGVDERSGAPSVLPYLLRTPGLATSTSEVVSRAEGLRTSTEGEAYRAWHQRLRHAWTLGTTDERAEDDVADVARKLATRIRTGTDAEQPTLLTVSVTAPLGPVSATVKKDIPEPRWLTRWMLDRHLRPHRRLLYRLALSERSYHDITKHLHAIWLAS